MTTITFDTLQFVQRLKKAGINEAEAEAIAEAVRDVQSNADVETKQDLSIVKAGKSRPFSFGNYIHNSHAIAHKNIS